FGLSGGFTFRVFLREDPVPGQPGVVNYHFGVSFSASVEARLFGFTFGSVGLSASIEAFGDGVVDLVANVSVSIKILFVRIHLHASFKIGTVTLPKHVYLAGNGPSDSQGTALWTGGALYLNVGQRAQATTGFPGRGIDDTAATPYDTYLVEHVEGTAGNETVRVIGQGRTQVFTGVSSIYA